MDKEKTLQVIFAALAVFTVWFVAVWVRNARRPQTNDPARFAPPTLIDLGIGFVTDFFDTWGIGSFATTTALFRATKSVSDRVIPGTLNVGHTIPTLLQAVFFIGAVDVDPLTLVLLIGASVAGAWLGAGVVSSWPTRQVRMTMGLALLIAAALMLGGKLDLLPKGGTAVGLTGGALVAGVVGNFVLGALMPMGIGLYGPCQVLIYLLGMSPLTAFPIMMGSCAFLMPVASARFTREGGYSLRGALGLTVGGLPAVYIAAKLMKKMDMSTVQWLVLGVVLYTAITMLLAARRARLEGKT